MGKYYSSSDASLLYEKSIKVPTILVKDPDVGLVAATIYGYIRYRMSLSEKNPERFEDKYGIYVIYKQKDLAKELNLSLKTISRHIDILKKNELVFIKQLEIGRPGRIYLRNLYSVSKYVQEQNDSHDGQNDSHDGQNDSHDGQNDSRADGQNDSHDGQNDSLIINTLESIHIDNKDTRTKVSEYPPVSEQFASFSRGNEELLNALYFWKNHRGVEENLKTHKPTKPKYLTERGCHDDLLKLQKLSNGDVRTMIEILYQSGTRCWQGLFPLKKDSRGSDMLHANISNEYGTMESGF